MIRLAAALIICCLAVATGARCEQRAWIELTRSGPQARVATSEAHCPSLTLDGRTVEMQVRAAPESGFPLTMCQLDLPPGVRDASLAGQGLPIPKGPPNRILIFGDTGCRVKGAETQDCNNPKAWPFADLARRAAARSRGAAAPPSGAGQRPRPRPRPWSRRARPWHRAGHPSR